MGMCETCKYWHKWNEWKEGDWAVCLMMGTDYSRRPIHENTKAISVDKEGEVETAPDFGCVMHEAK